MLVKSESGYRAVCIYGQAARLEYLECMNFEGKGTRFVVSIFYQEGIELF